MTVRELIEGLLDFPMEATVRLNISEKQKMSDLIRREDAIKAVWGEDTNPSEDGVVFEAQSHIDRDIRLIPSEDRPQDDEFKNFDRESLILLIEAQKERIGELMADRPQGEWIDMGDFEKCSVCKGTRLKEFQSYYGKVTWMKTPYCPNCGARMLVKDINVPNKKGADDEV